MAFASHAAACRKAQPEHQYQTERALSQKGHLLLLPQIINFYSLAEKQNVALFTKLFHQALESVTLGLGLREFLAVLARVDGYRGPAVACELVVILDPFDAFLRFTAAALALKLDLGIVDSVGHVHLHEER
jgi:hypothetical protein